MLHFPFPACLRPYLAYCHTLSLLYAKWMLSSQIHLFFFFKITLWGLPATQKALNNCFYMRSKLDIVWKSLGCACKQQSWYVGDHQYGQFYWREKKKKKRNQLELFVFTRRSVSYLLVKRKCLFPLLSFFYCSTLPDHIESKRSWIYIHPVVEGEKQNKWP